MVSPGWAHKVRCCRLCPRPHLRCGHAGSWPRCPSGTVLTKPTAQIPTRQSTEGGYQEHSSHAPGLAVGALETAQALPPCVLPPSPQLLRPDPPPPQCTCCPAPRAHSGSTKKEAAKGQAPPLPSLAPYQWCFASVAGPGFFHVHPWLPPVPHSRPFRLSPCSQPQSSPWVCPLKPEVQHPAPARTSRCPGLGIAAR